MNLRTGRLKTRKDWYTKFMKITDKDLSFIPFSKRFLIIFGDHVLFSPWNMKSRLSILDLAQQCRWNFQTTDEKVRN